MGHFNAHLRAKSIKKVGREHKTPLLLLFFTSIINQESNASGTNSLRVITARAAH
jgi:hypothetical protein